MRADSSATVCTLAASSSEPGTSIKWASSTTWAAAGPRGAAIRTPCTPVRSAAKAARNGGAV